MIDLLTSSDVETGAFIPIEKQSDSPGSIEPSAGQVLAIGLDAKRLSLCDQAPPFMRVFVKNESDCLIGDIAVSEDELWKVRQHLDLYALKTGQKVEVASSGPTWIVYRVRGSLVLSCRVAWLCRLR